MVPLDGAVPLSQMDHISIRIRQDLELNVSWILYKMFNVHRRIGKCHLGLFLSRLECRLELFRCPGGTHTFAPTS